MARIAPNRIPVVKGRSTARIPRSRPAKSRSRKARSRSCVVPVEGTAPALSLSDRGLFAIAIGHLPMHQRGKGHAAILAPPGRDQRWDHPDTLCIFRWCAADPDRELWAERALLESGHRVSGGGRNSVVAPTV